MADPQVFDPNYAQAGAPQPLSPVTGGAPAAAPAPPAPGPDDLQTRADQLLKTGAISAEQYNKLMQAMGKGGGFKTGVKSPDIAGAGGVAGNLGATAGNIVGGLGKMAANGISSINGALTSTGSGADGTPPQAVEVGAGRQENYPGLSEMNPSPQWNQ